MIVVNKYILLLVSIVLFLSCEKAIDYNGDELKNFMVLNAEVYADSLITCHLTRSNTILESNKILPLTNATVLLTVDNGSSEVLTSDSLGFYASTLRASVGSKVRFEVNYPSFKSLNASCILSPKALAVVDAMSVEKVTDPNCLECSYDALVCKIRITDPSVDNYYRLVVFVKSVMYSYYGTKDSIKTWYPQRIKSSDPVLNGNTVVTEMSDNPPNEYCVFNDELFNGQDYVLTFSISEYHNVDFNKDVQFYVQSISKDLYLYYKTLDAQRWYGDSPFSEPVQLHTNVKGGAGIVGGVTTTIITYTK